MIDFTNLPVRNKTYAGANGSKISVLYNDELYMLKFPAVPAINKQMSYANGCVSEYLGCHIFESIGIPVHHPVIAEGNINTPEKARQVLELGAFCVVVGSAITRPQVITRTFVQAIERIS